ncbi:MAG: ribonuclease P protein component [Actinobacteria bacterium]|uniref:Unannotated protein n=1 Tax=freshwater metagenome TaxID=449393 RepID=A0A6J6RFT2_9ZZZZ|nr:ribonuclease P protein component [Actinomycetota bacterium]
MLAAPNRLTDADTFRAATRSGRRAGSRTVVTHLLVGGSSGAPRVGFVVSKAVGNAVVRNRVKRRLRHLTRERLGLLPGSAVLVVRALPAADEVSVADLGADLDRCLARCLDRALT